MKILKEGKWHLPWTTEAVCEICEARLLIEEPDVKPTYDEHNKFYWVCAVCGKVNDLPAQELTQRVRESVEKKRRYCSSSDW